jgi:hypothetical protein
MNADRKLLVVVSKNETLQMVEKDFQKQRMNMES